MLSTIIDNQYFQALMIVLAFFLAAKIITYISNRYLKKWSAKTASKLDDLIVAKLKPPFIYIIVLFGFQIAISHLETGIFWVESLVRSIMALFLIYAALIIINISLEFWIDIYKKRNPSKMVDSLLPLFRKTVTVILIIVALIWILDIWKVNIAPFLASLGIAGFVIGFAMQDSLKNIFGGITMILDKTLQVGDRVSLEGGEMGIIAAVSIRSTKIRTFNNELLTIPNGRLSEAKITNYTQPDLKLRVVIDFSTVYGSDIQQVKDLVEKTIQEIPDVCSDPAVSVIMTAMADSGLSWQARFWVDDQGIAYDKKIESLAAVYQALNRAGIDIPFPTRTVYLKSEKKEAGDE